MSIQPQRLFTEQSNETPVSSLLPEKFSEKKFRNSLMSMPLGQLQETLSLLTKATDSSCFDIESKSFDKQIRQASRIAHIFSDVITEKKLTNDLKQSPDWDIWKTNLKWIDSCYSLIPQEEAPSYSGFPISWH